MERYSLIIAGGGAGGLMCAALLASSGFNDILILERNDRVGKKLSATGNGQGNLTNLAMGAEHYFSDDLPLVQAVLSAFDNGALTRFFARLGVYCLPDEKGRVYPASRQASCLTDALRGFLAAKGVRVYTGCPVERAGFADGCFSVLAGGNTYLSPRLVLAAGGKAQKSFGTDGGGYAMAGAFGHTVTPLFPSLVQLKTDTGLTRSLKGIRADAVLSAKREGKHLFSARGDVIFTEYGVSGNAAFAVSPYLAPYSEAELSLSFLPDVKKEDIVRFLREKGENRPDLPQGEMLGGLLNNQIGRAVLKSLPAYSPEAAAERIKRFPLRYQGTLGFDYAQVTKGGVPLKEVFPSLESRKQKGLYLIGELLNVDGECGGYNLQWAFSSAFAAAKAIRESVI